MSDNLVDLKEMAKLLSIAPETLRGYVQRKQIRFYKLPAEQNRGELRFDPDEVREDLRRGA